LGNIHPIPLADRINLKLLELPGNLVLNKILQSHLGGFGLANPIDDILIQPVEWFQSFVDNVPYGLGLIDENLNIVLINRQAQIAFSAFGEAIKSTSLKNGKVIHSPQMTRLISAVRQALNGQLVLFHERDEQLAIAVAPFGLSNGQTGVMLTTERIGSCDTLTLMCYGRMLGLTHAEVRVLAKLTEGEGPETVAEGLAISIATVRSHIRSILCKTEASNMRSLLLRLSKLPPLTLCLANGALN
jgi:DNA-binding CsgD family transcriptional regulator